jgi:spoIIIJ-associated protein
LKRSLEAEGGSIDEAIARALESLGLDRARAEVEILRDARRGLLGFGGQKARVRVSERGPLVEASDDTRNVAPEAAPAGGPARTGAQPAAENVLREMLRMMDFPAEVEASADPETGQTALSIASESGALLIGRHGQTLDSIEYLVNRVAGRGEDGGRVIVDAEGYRERRRRSLTEMALRLAGDAKRSGNAETMMPMTPRDRRIVHLALQADPRVSTRSLGDGHLKSVVISPVRAARRPQRQPR